MQDYLPSRDRRLLNLRKEVSDILPVAIGAVYLSRTISTLISSPFPAPIFLT